MTTPAEQQKQALITPILPHLSLHPSQSSLPHLPPLKPLSQKEVDKKRWGREMKKW